MDVVEKLLKDISTKYDEQAQSGATKVELKAIKDAMDELKSNSKEENDKLEKVLKAHGELLGGMKSGREDIPQSEQKQINEYIDKNIEDIKKAMRNGTYVEFEVKAVGNVTTASGTLVDAPRALGPLTNTNLRTADLMRFVNVTETGLAQFSYSEAVPKDGQALNVAEGTAKPQIDIEWKQRYVAPTKVAAWMSVTDESIADVIGLKSLVRDTLRKKHDIAVEKDVYFGDGTGSNSEGATTIGRTFVAGGMATNVVNPSLIDVVNACIVDIASTQNYVDETPYIANTAFVSPVDFFLNFAAKKDANGLPMYPNASLFNELKFGPTTIVPTFRMAQDKIFVADMTRYHVVVLMSYVVKVGLINDDFIKNQKAVLGESRYYSYVQFLDKAAFIFDNISTIMTDITAP